MASSNYNPLPNDWMVQGKYLYVQAAGSDGSDGTVAGRHVRWAFMDNLAANHLPKGTASAGTGQFSTSIGFNNPQDYVEIYRTEYDVPCPVRVDLKNDLPTSVVETGGTRSWTFEVEIFSGPPSQVIRQVEFRFEDHVNYDTIRQVIDPTSSPGDPVEFLKEYFGVVEVEVLGELLFATTICTEHPEPGAGSFGSIRIETISAPYTGATSNQLISCRKTFEIQDLEHSHNEGGGDGDGGDGRDEDGGDGDDGSSEPGPNCFRGECENIQYIRFDYVDGYPIQVDLETYADFIADKRTTWQQLGQYALSLVDSDVFAQLENPSAGPINEWPKYNGGSTVRVTNYRDRWLGTVNEPGLSYAVEQYLTLSTTDLQANASLPSSDPNDQATLDISYLQWLNVVGLDFHNARMLGMGDIDTSSTQVGPRYVYIAQYSTSVDMDTLVPGTNLEHTAMSLPTGVTDYRLPPAPALEPVDYGISVDVGNGNVQQITDANGYLPWDDVRIVNISKKPYSLDVPFGPFFSPPHEFCRCEYTRPVSFGLEYRAKGAPNWEVPELSHDPLFIDPQGIKETVDIPEGPNPFYRHHERNSGPHEYSGYGINWFSRVSGLSNIVQTDATGFPKRNTLLPPLDLGAHYIQTESPLIFTTGLEQSNHLKDTRVTFNWNHVNNHAYQKGNRAQFFFRESEPKNVVGEIVAVNDLGGGLAEVVTGDLNIQSTNPPQVLVPNVPPGDEMLFEGAQFSTPTGQFVVDSVIQTNPSTGDYPKFVVKKISDIDLTNPNSNGIYVPIQNWILPGNGERFLLVENINSSSPGQWTQLQKEITLIHFDGSQAGFPNYSYSENFVETDGTTTVFEYGGVFDSGNLISLGNGMYQFDFATFILQQHPDAGVEWYLGTVRAWDVNGVVKEMPVFRIQEIGGVNPTQLFFYDADNQANPLALGSVSVNFHPGYRVYLEHEPGFDGSTLEPAPGTGIKKTYLSVRSVDTTIPNCVSPLQVPAMLMAREIVPPLPPGPPIGPTFATRPDFYGKSTYSFDCEVELENGGTFRKPHALVFYRATEYRLLEALYLPATVATIYDDLEAIPNDPFVTQRWQDLASFQVETSGPDQDKFLEHNGYRFPNPDNSNTDPLFTGNALPGTILANVKEALYSMFVALTEQPLIYDYLSTGEETSDSKPVIKDGLGNPLDPTDPAFAPFPMARLIDDTPPQGKVRFTDYTLDGASTHLYFYCGREISNMQEMSTPSPITGPISLVNSMPAKTPEIKNVIPEVAGFNGTFAEVSTQKAVVKLQINDYIESEGIKKVRIYRGNTALESQSVRTMTLAQELDVSTNLVDDFSDLQFPPYGETLFYRVVALREILNEDSQPELVPSQASNTVLTSVIDVNNPESPDISHSIGSITNGPDQYHNVQLTWNKTTHNGKYYLYKMSNSGSWKLIYEIATNDPTISYPPAGNFNSPNDATALLDKEDIDNNPIFHRFMVRAENASGLLSIEDNDFVI